MDRVRKNAIKIFKETGLKIEIQTHLKIVRFLDVIFSTYRPYEKSNDSSLYINTSSSHPPQQRKQKRNRGRNIISFNPPFSGNVTTNIAKRFLNLLDLEFPKSNKVHMIFNRNTIKVRYCSTENLSRIIKAHNKKVTNEKITPKDQCSCGNKNSCSLGSNFQTTNHC